MADASASSTFQTVTPKVRSVEEATTFFGVFSPAVSSASPEQHETCAVAGQQDAIVIPLRDVSSSAPTEEMASSISASEANPASCPATADEFNVYKEYSYTSAKID